MKKKRTLKERISDIQLAGGFLKQSMKQAFNLANGKEVTSEVTAPYGDLEYREKEILNTDGFVILNERGKRVLHATKVNIEDVKASRDGFTAFEYSTLQPVWGMLNITGKVKQINTKCGKKIIVALKKEKGEALVTCQILKADMFDEVCDCARELLYTRRPDICIHKSVEEIRRQINILEKEANK